ncbi:hypothetical protein BS78_04G132400 [Paspalum vaginatum]|nr:hypothetical protein BS78_04G132400 [Paspalum vaginatum]
MQRKGEKMARPTQPSPPILGQEGDSHLPLGLSPPPLPLSLPSSTLSLGLLPLLTPSPSAAAPSLPSSAASCLPTSSTSTAGYFPSSFTSAATGAPLPPPPAGRRSGPELPRRAGQIRAVRRRLPSSCPGIGKRRRLRWLLRSRMRLCVSDTRRRGDTCRLVKKISDSGVRVTLGTALTPA